MREREEGRKREGVEKGKGETWTTRNVETNGRRKRVSEWEVRGRQKEREKKRER